MLISNQKLFPELWSTLYLRHKKNTRHSSLELLQRFFRHYINQLTLVFYVLPEWWLSKKKKKKTLLQSEIFTAKLSGKRRPNISFGNFPHAHWKGAKVEGVWGGGGGCEDVGGSGDWVVSQSMRGGGKRTEKQQQKIQGGLMTCWLQEWIDSQPPSWVIRMCGLTSGEDPDQCLIKMDTWVLGAAQPLSFLAHSLVSHLHR